jgi:hemolysin activation/secretion protein
MLPRESALLASALITGAFFFWPSVTISFAQSSTATAPATSTTSTNAVHPMMNRTAVNYFYIQEFRVEGGGNLIPQAEVGEAVYPYLGPYRSEDDIRQACATLEKMYRDKGYVFVSVDYGPQKTKSGIIYLQVHLNEVGRLRVKGSRYYSVDEIKKEVPSLAEGKVFNINDANKDIISLSQLRDRQVSILPHPGVVPGTYDIDLNVKDTLPLHGSLEINNRYSADTDPLRINGSIDYDNLWQLGHTISASFQVAPQDPSQVKVFSGYYEAGIPGVDWINFMLSGTDQNSNVNTLGGISVAGIGQTIGLSAIINLPSDASFYQSVSLGVDYKHYEQNLLIAGVEVPTPVTYYPLSAAYSASWVGKDYQTLFDPSINMNLSGLGSNQQEFEINRHGASPNYIYFRGDLSHTHDLPGGFQAYVKAQGQIANQPLVNNEQFSGGGLSTVRGYLESEELGDNAIFGSVEMRSPSIGSLIGKLVDEWRFYLFSEGGWLTINQPLPEQQVSYTLASVGAGTRVKIDDHFHGSLDFGVPLKNGTTTNAFDMQLTFRIWAEF